MIGPLFKFIASNKMATANAVFSGVSGLDSYEQARQEGAGVAGAIGTAALDTALSMTMGLPLYMAYEGLKAGVSFAASTGYQQYQQASRAFALSNRQRPFSNAQFNDTEQAYTMRQAGMAIAQRTRSNTEQAMLGNEAKYMARY